MLMKCLRRRLPSSTNIKIQPAAAWCITSIYIASIAPRKSPPLGLDEIFDREAVALIEWGERFPQLLPRTASKSGLEPLSARPAESKSPRTSTLRQGQPNMQPCASSSRIRTFSAALRSSEAHAVPFQA